MNNISVRDLLIYPIKGLTGQKRDRVDLKVGRGICGDRAFALMFSDSPTDADSKIVPWMKKQHFAMQNDWGGLAALDCSYEKEVGILRVKRKGVELLVADTNSSTGRDLIGAFFTGYLAGIYPSQSARHGHRVPLQLVGDGTNTRYPDREAVHVSLVSQATLDNLTEVAGKFVDVRRFRPNIVVDGIPAWSEFDWVGKEIQIGEARVAVTARINRCLNIEVNPETGERDLSLLSLLQNKFQHVQTGVLAQVKLGGCVAIGDKVKLS